MAFKMRGFPQHAGAGSPMKKDKDVPKVETDWSSHEAQNALSTRAMNLYSKNIKGTDRDTQDNWLKFQSTIMQDKGLTLESVDSYVSQFTSPIKQKYGKKIIHGEADL